MFFLLVRLPVCKEYLSFPLADVSEKRQNRWFFTQNAIISENSCNFLDCVGYSKNAGRKI
uniref:Uncharacterized protein n=1 Tax=Romanomermis culicivorax TaxID=13658 RepID=A0A915J9E3_ROMCU